MAEPTDREQLIALIHRNRIAVWTGDFEAYQACFVHAPYTARWNASPFAGIFVRQGWDEIARRTRLTLADPAFRNPAFAYETSVENLNLQIGTDMAWATYLQRYPGTPDHHAGSSPSHEVRFFEKHDGEWRIAFLGFLDADAAGTRDAPLLRLAEDGAVISQTPAAEAALAEDDDLVIRGGKLHIRDSRADQRLQAAIRWAASLDSAMLPGKGALPIVLDAGEGLPAKVWWVTAGSGKIQFALRDARLDAQRLEAAAIVYGLSEAQQKVAALVVAGKSLTEVAAQLAITANTARTHLDRIFEKTGVRTQPALVRVLLSTGAPV